MRVRWSSPELFPVTTFSLHLGAFSYNVEKCSQLGIVLVALGKLSRSHLSFSSFLDVLSVSSTQNIPPKRFCFGDEEFGANEFQPHNALVQLMLLLFLPGR